MPKMRSVGERASAPPPKQQEAQGDPVQEKLDVLDTKINQVLNMCEQMFRMMQGGQEEPSDTSGMMM